jgi:hypothetical protein
MRKLLPLIAASLFASAPLSAQEAAPPPPPLPQEVIDTLPEEGGLEPQVTIIRRGEDVIEEYRVGGQLYMIKITPSKGLPYYLMDSDGDGSLETRRNELDNPEVVKWRIFSW